MLQNSECYTRLQSFCQSLSRNSPPTWYFQECGPLRTPSALYQDRVHWLTRFSEYWYSNRLGSKIPKNVLGQNISGEFSSSPSPAALNSLNIANIPCFSFECMWGITVLKNFEDTKFYSFWSKSGRIILLMIKSCEHWMRYSILYFDV